MEVAVNPVTSRQFGKEDGKEDASEHLLNENIKVSDQICF